MADEPLTTGELGRMFQALRQDVQAMAAGINARLDRVVSTEVYALQSAHFDQRLNDHAREVQKVHDDLDTLENAFEAYQRAEQERREKERQARLYQLVIPVLFGVLTLAVAVWAVVAK